MEECKCEPGKCGRIENVRCKATMPARQGSDTAAEHEHLVVKDVFGMLTRKPRTMPGDCYCVRCGQPVPYELRDAGDGQGVRGWPVVDPA